MYQTPSQQNKSTKVWYQWVEIEFNLGGLTNKSKKYRKLQLQLLFNLSLSLSLHTHLHWVILSVIICRTVVTEKGDVTR